MGSRTELQFKRDLEAAIKKFDLNDDPPEKKIEEYWCKVAIKNGWIAWKFMSANNRSIPDRIFMRDGYIFFIEFKRKGKKPTETQLEKHEQLRAQGFMVLVVDRIDKDWAWLTFL